LSFSLNVLLKTAVPSQPSISKVTMSSANKGRSEVRAAAAVFKGVDGNDFGADRTELGLELTGADLVQARFEKRRIRRVDLRRSAIFFHACRKASR